MHTLLSGLLCILALAVQPKPQHHQEMEMAVLAPAAHHPDFADPAPVEVVGGIFHNLGRFLRR